MSKKIISLVLSLCIIFSLFAVVGSVTVSAAVATVYNAGDVIIDFENNAGITFDSNISFIEADASYNGTRVGVLTKATPTVIVFEKPIAIEGNKLALDVSNIFRSYQIKVTLMNGGVELDTKTVNIPNIDNTIGFHSSSSSKSPFEDRTNMYTLFYTFSNLTEDQAKNITAIKIESVNDSKTPYIDNLRVAKTGNSKTLIDFEDESGIARYMNLTMVDSTTSFSGTRSAQLTESAPVGQASSWQDLTAAYGMVQFTDKKVVDGKTLTYDVKGLTATYVNFYFMDGSKLVKLFTKVWQNHKASEVYHKELDISSIYGQTYDKIIIETRSWSATDLLQLDNIHIVSDFEANSEAPTISGTEISVDENNAYANGRLVINGSISENSINKTLAVDGMEIAELGVVVMPVNNFSGELTKETEGVSIATVKTNTKDYSVAVVNEDDYSDITLAVRTYAVWTDGTKTRTSYSDVYKVMGTDLSVATEEIVMGDATGDSAVNVLDFIAIVKAQTENVAVFYQADVDANNVINSLDMVAIKKFLLGIDGTFADKPYIAGDAIATGDWTIDYKTTILDFENTAEYTVTGNSNVSYNDEDASFNSTNTIVLPITKQTYTDYTFEFKQPIALADSVIALEAGKMIGTDRMKLALYNGENQLAEVEAILPSNSYAGTPYEKSTNYYIMYFDFGALTKAQLNCITAFKISTNKYKDTFVEIDNIRTVESSNGAANGGFDNIESTHALKINKDGMLENSTGAKSTEAWGSFAIGYIDFKDTITLSGSTVTLDIKNKNGYEFIYIELYNGKTKIEGTGYDVAGDNELGGLIDRREGTFSFTTPVDISGQKVTRAVIYCMLGETDVASSVTFSNINFQSAQ